MPGHLLGQIVNRAGSIPARLRTRLSEERIISIERPDARGQVLLSYALWPFLIPREQALAHGHTQAWEARAIADAFIAEGFAVDVISYRNKVFMPKKRYDFLVDARWNLERLSDVLGPDCMKVMHIDIANVLFHNAAEARRLLDLQRRRGVTLMPRRYETPNRGIEFADCATMLGNDFTYGTYAYARKPIYRVPISAPALQPQRRPKDFDACRRTFLWLGTRGLVHKGLDLVLEAFAQMPQYRLIVCGPIDNEPDFVAAYRTELYHTPNIRTIGWIDVGGQEFRDLADSCIALVFPSCSEGQSGSTVTCMHAGLIPIASYESGVDIAPECGIILRTSTIEEIKEAVSRIANLPTGVLRDMSEATARFAQTTHNQRNFAETYRRIVRTLIAARASARDTRPAING